jgi:hypothetical protein
MQLETDGKEEVVNKTLRRWKGSKGPKREDDDEQPINKL